MAKTKEDKLSKYYFPLLVMLGIGIMAIYMMSSMERKTADFYVFTIGAVVYLVSVLTSWLSEKKKFDDLPERIEKDTQVSALKVQKKSFEDVLDITKRRLMFQGAATAAFAAAAVLAGVAYMKEKTLGKKAQKSFAALTQEVRAKCAQIPLVNAQPTLLHAKTQVPLKVSCQKNANQLAACVSKMQAGQTRLNQLNEMIRSPNGSQAANTKNVGVSNQIDESLIQCLGPVLSETRSAEQQSMQTSVIIQPEEFNQRIKNGKYFEQNGKKFVYLPPLKTGRYYDKNATYMEKYFSDEELKDFTEKEISYFNKVKPDMSLIDNLIIGQLQAQEAGSLTSDAARLGASKATKSYAGGLAGDQVNDFKGMMQSSVEENAERRGASDLELAIELSIVDASIDAGAAGVTGKALGAVSDAAGEAAAKATEATRKAARQAATRRASRLAAEESKRMMEEATRSKRFDRRARARQGSSGPKRATSRPGYRKTAVKRLVTNGSKVIAKRATQIAVVAAVGAAGVMSAPITGTVITVAGAAMLARDLYNITNTHLKNVTGKGIKERAKGAWNSLKSWWSSSVGPPLRDDFNLLSFFMPTAHALAPGMSLATVQTLKRTSSKAADEADKWIYNPKGRMILYGAVTVLVGFITKSTLETKKQLEKDIEQIESLIQSMKKNGQQDTGDEEQREKDESEDQEDNDKVGGLKQTFDDFKFLQLTWSWIFPKAMASIDSNGSLPFAIPCLTQYRGKCLSNKQFIERNLLSSVRYSPLVLQAAARSAKLGDMIQNKRTVTPEFEAEAKRLNTLMPQLLASHELTKRHVNNLQKHKYKEQKIPFDALETKLASKFLKIAEDEVKNSNADLDLKSLFGPMSKSAKPLDLNSTNKSLDDLMEMNTAAIEDNQAGMDVTSYSKNGAVKKKAEILKHTHQLPNEGINTNKEINIFEQISRRYYLWQAED